MMMHSRRRFLSSAAAGAAGFGLAGFAAGAGGGAPQSAAIEAFPRPNKDAISLALFSLNRSFTLGLWNLLDVPRICREEFNIDGIEYVTIYFKDVRYQSFLRHLKQRASDYGVANVLIMVDQEGDMASPDKAERVLAAKNHHKWIDIAHYLGCFAIRCNATGVGKTVAEDPDGVDRAAESFNSLLDYARQARIVVTLENHGSGLASNAEWLVSLAKKIGNPNFGLLPDYGNFGFSEPEKTYQAVRTTMPYAYDISVKGSWAPDGTHPRFSLDECLRISKQEFGYTGYWGIESSIRRPRPGGGTAAADSPSPLQVRNDEWNAVKWTADTIRRVVLKST